jgi:hypothetical protein
VPVHERSETIVAQALERLRAEDERLGGDAEAALSSLTWDEGLETITQYGLQRFLWYELPRKWMTDLEGRRHLAMALGRVLDLVGLPRYAGICRSPETDAVLAAYERDDREGFAAFRRAEERSGVHPPDLPELTWGPVMGVREAGGFWSTAAALELAVAGGELRPGRRGWRAAQQAIARRHLTAARPELDGRTWVEVVVGERVGEWARSRGQARRALVEPLSARLQGGPVEVPAGVAEAVAPLRWLLARAGEGIALTLLLDADEVLQAELVERVHAAVVGEGWHDQATARPPDPEAVHRQLAEPLRLLRVLGLSREGGDWQARTIALTGVGRATALEALRARATGPRPDPFRG